MRAKKEETMSKKNDTPADDDVGLEIKLSMEEGVDGWIVRLHDETGVVIYSSKTTSYDPKAQTPEEYMQVIFDDMNAWMIAQIGE